jgi:CelD/BcsL family acetyltransferase involved in cellulose biosynthesis
MRLEVVDTVDRLQTLGPEWEALRFRDAQTDVFASFDWFLTWWEHFGNGSGPAALVVHDGDALVDIPGQVDRLHVLLVREGDKLTGIVPLIAVRGLWKKCPVRVLAPPLNSHAPRSGIICADNATTVSEALALHLAESSGWDMMILDGLPRDSGCVSTFRGTADRQGLRRRNDSSWTHSLLACEGTFEHYLNRKGYHFRRHLRQLGRALAQLGPVTATRYETPAEVEKGMRAFMEIDRESWKAMEGESIGLSAEVGSFYSDLAQRFVQRNRCEIWILWIGDEPAAGYLCLRDQNALYTLKTSYKRKFSSARHSAGFILLGRIVEDAWRRNLSHIDFVGKLPFTERWASGTREFDGLVLCPTRAHIAFFRILDWSMNRAHYAKSLLNRVMPRGEGRAAG